jgi:uracil-DNA glycosylase
MKVELLIKNLKTDWKIPLLKNEKVLKEITPYYEKINKFLMDKNFEPKDIFRALNYFNLKETKVVILGQDPYPNPKYSNGLAFSVPFSSKRLPGSLKNIIKESGYKHDNKNDYLEEWAKQGVLLLNTVLTINGKNSHKNKGWEEITNIIIRLIDKNVKDCIFLLMGKQAQKKISLIKNNKFISVSHPSPLSAKKTEKPFLGSNCFKRINELLKNKIKW